MDYHVLLLLILLPIILPLLFFELPVIIDATPKWLLKILCFAPTGAMGVMVIKVLMLKDYGLGLISAFLFCIVLYGSFTLKGMIRS